MSSVFMHEPRWIPDAASETRSVDDAGCSTNRHPRITTRRPSVYQACAFGRIWSDAAPFWAVKTAEETLQRMFRDQGRLTPRLWIEKPLAPYFPITIASTNGGVIEVSPLHSTTVAAIAAASDSLGSM